MIGTPDSSPLHSADLVSDAAVTDDDFSENCLYPAYMDVCPGESCA